MSSQTPEFTDEIRAALRVAIKYPPGVLPSEESMFQHHPSLKLITEPEDTEPRTLKNILPELLMQDKEQKVVIDSSFSDMNFGLQSISSVREGSLSSPNSNDPSLDVWYFTLPKIEGFTQTGSIYVHSTHITVQIISQLKQGNVTCAGPEITQGRLDNCYCSVAYPRRSTLELRSVR
ncbi:hypothetical protein TREMEDRAFT_62412 [Tremella mesenterica DSM 1558]|uniref:uncharacterized protein n=1 Tax=Tremella mesenterica (strain ATCC 24925 / CBS 8224 / DSM 1558 / NBRC 9311 / NRRL Y-6157 / RJB 2259-6 / UBC 559-6) TaxID=578456 RepID=UPI0003F49D06|nr:uncharacterized protein TREMEDRAFT_62412 [Tremella mesenterica DSM 1558]EIW69551.1 hypothetical protein TREMEDRAFT_62412 [Tremella mesenterica DSM 1558]